MKKTELKELIKSLLSYEEESLEAYRTLQKSIGIVNTSIVVDLLIKGRKALPIGTVRNGRKKMPSGIWVPVGGSKRLDAENEEKQKATLGQVKEKIKELRQSDLTKFGNRKKLLKLLVATKQPLEVKVKFWKNPSGVSQASFGLYDKKSGAMLDTYKTPAGFEGTEKTTEKFTKQYKKDFVGRVVRKFKEHVFHDSVDSSIQFVDNKQDMDKTSDLGKRKKAQEKK